MCHECERVQLSAMSQRVQHPICARRDLRYCAQRLCVLHDERVHDLLAVGNAELRQVDRIAVNNAAVTYTSVKSANVCQRSTALHCKQQAKEVIRVALISLVSLNGRTPTPVRKQAQHFHAIEEALDRSTHSVRCPKQLCEFVDGEPRVRDGLDVSGQQATPKTKWQTQGKFPCRAVSSPFGAEIRFF